MEINSKIFMGQVIRDLRNEKGLKADELAAMLTPKKSAGTITAWERGETEPSSEYIVQLCKMFDVQPGVFFPVQNALDISAFDVSKINTLNGLFLQMSETQRNAILCVARAMVEP
jgi:transcriptional regulator with XRE-family HTH domain